jgi:hypothetical protein
MRLTTEALNTRLIVRRLTRATGAAPYRWEVYRDETAEPIFVSPDRFGTMDAAYRAGHARLKDFVLPERSRRLGLDE